MKENFEHHIEEEGGEMFKRRRASRRSKRPRNDDGPGPAESIVQNAAARNAAKL
jgi:hypothetical protein